jgi:hypothetical protein
MLYPFALRNMKAVSSHRSPKKQDITTLKRNNLSIPFPARYRMTSNGEQNRSIIIRRSRREHVAGYLRIDNRFAYAPLVYHYDPQRLSHAPGKELHPETIL